MYYDYTSILALLMGGEDRLSCSLLGALRNIILS